MRKLIRQMLRFAAVGLSAFALDYVLFMVLHMFGMSYLIANIISYTLSTVYNFVLSMRFVFSGKSGQSRLQQFVIFLVLGLVGLGLNELYLWLLVDFCHIAPAISKLVAAFLVTIFNFITRKIFLEDRAPKEEPPLEPGQIGEALGAGLEDVEVILHEELNIVTGKSEIKIL
ncbi:MAG: GtrA family protein [Coriobacteriales bacterium]